VQALVLIGEFRRQHPNITVKTMLADAWFGARRLLDPVSDFWGQIQAASHLRRERWSTTPLHACAHGKEGGRGRNTLARRGEVD